MKIILTLALLLPLLTACTDADQTEAKRPFSPSAKTIKNHKFLTVEDGLLTELHGYDLAAYQPLEIENFDIALNDLKVEHVLIMAVEACDTTMVRQLLADGADPRFKIDGDDLITEIVYCGEAAVALTKLFLQYGADINGSDQDEDSFLSYAIGSDHLELVRLIIDNGGELEKRDTNLGCPPYFSIESQAMFEYLLQAGINPLATCKTGRTLLHIAARENLPVMATYLMKKGVNQSSVDSNGKTAKEYARHNDNDVMLKMLE